MEKTVLTYLDRHPHCEGCPVSMYCGTAVQSTRLCKSYKPEPEEIIEAILFSMADNYAKCIYDKDTNSFIATQPITSLRKDDGGAIESEEVVDVDEYTISYEEGITYLKAMLDFLNELKSPTPAPVSPWFPSPEDDELPF